MTLDTRIGRYARSLSLRLIEFATWQLRITGERIETRTVNLDFSMVPLY
jgi:hypothetical protein